MNTKLLEEVESTGRHPSLALAHFDACHDRAGNYGITGGTR